MFSPSENSGLHRNGFRILQTIIAFHLWCPSLVQFVPNVITNLIYFTLILDFFAETIAKLCHSNAIDMSKFTSSYPIVMILIGHNLPKVMPESSANLISVQKSHWLECCPLSVHIVTINWKLYHNIHDISFQYKNPTITMLLTLAKWSTLGKTRMQ